ncbi:MAG: tRNA uridine-5-carboxymethylaminomethyl(34) synthesis GTPase MnmE [Pseudomonadota bacterium]
MNAVQFERPTIVALSSGLPPAAIGVIRVSGPKAGLAIENLAGSIPQPRRATLRGLRDANGHALDDALVLWFPGTGSATGEDLAEFQCHGGRAVVAAIESALLELPDLRAAEPGEFTRRAFLNGRIDLAQAEGLGDLLAAETELQRASAIANAKGAISDRVTRWRSAVLQLSAQIEAALDFSDEDDVQDLPESFTWNIRSLVDELDLWLSRPCSEKLGEGFKIVLAGPPNSGKSSLFNALIESEAAIISPIAGTTRDALERNVAIQGVPLSFVDTAGLRSQTDDSIEQIGMERAREAMEGADLVLWLGEEGKGPEGCWEIAARCDAEDFKAKASARFTLSAMTGEGLPDLKGALVLTARSALPKPGEAALNARQHGILQEARTGISVAEETRDLLLVGEELRTARVAFDRLIGKATTEDMLDTLFGRFCIGK